MENESSNFDKIKDDVLRELALSRSEEEVGVSIVIYTPQEPLILKQGPELSSANYSRFQLPVTEKLEGEGNEIEIKNRALRVGVFLEELLDHDINYIEQSKAFFTTASGSQISQIIEHPDIQSILRLEEDRK